MQTTRKRTRTRSIRFSVRPSGAIYCFVVAQVSSVPRREKVIASLGNRPSEEAILAACRQYDAKVPRSLQHLSKGYARVKF